MAAVPQIVPSTEVGGLPGAVRLDPQEFGSLVTQGTRAWGEALGTIGKEAERTGEALARAKTAKNLLEEEDKKLDLDRAGNDFDRQLADAIVTMKQDPSVDPETYDRVIDDRGRQIAAGVAKTLRYADPVHQTRFQRTAENALTKKVIQGKYDALEQQLARVRSETDLALQRDANQAVFGDTPEAQDAAVARANERITTLVAKKILTGPEGSARSTGFLKDVTTGRLLRDFATAERDPDRGRGDARQQGLIADLYEGKHPTLDPDVQVKLAETLTNRREARLREEVRISDKQERALARAVAEEREVVTDGFYERAARGDLGHEELNRAVRDRTITPDDARQIRDRIYRFEADATKAAAERSAAGGRTDDAVYNRIELDILARSRPVSRQEIRRLQEQGKLAASGPRSAATLLRMVEDQKEKAGEPKDITKDPMFDQGLDDIKLALRGGKGLMSDLTEAETLRMRNGIREFHDLARSGKFRPADLPEVARKIIDRGLSTRDIYDKPALPATAAQQLRYRTPADLAAAKRAGLIPDAEFNRQVQLMKDLGIIPSPGPAAPGTPTPEVLRGGRR
jgi:hypothetical protein